MDTLVTRSPRNAAATKERILESAIWHFGEHGYPATGLRDIAERADVSLPLLSRYFGSKAGLFEAALRRSLLTPYLQVPRAEFGESLVTLICTKVPGINPTAIVSLSTGDPAARKIANEVIEELIMLPLTSWLGGPGARRRAEAITMLGAGLNTHVHLLPVTQLAQPVDLTDPLLAWFSTALQQIVDGVDNWAG